MSQPATITREAVQTRSVRFTTFRRSDGLWDVEAQLDDCRLYPFVTLEGDTIAAGDPYHGMRVILTLDQGLKIDSIRGEMYATPFSECVAALDPLQQLVGVTLGRGWRKVVDQALERSCSCAHMREMLYMAPSAAIQSIPGYSRMSAGKRWPPEPVPGATDVPHFIGGCYSWRQDAPAVKRHFPDIYTGGEGAASDE